MRMIDKWRGYDHKINVPVTHRELATLRLAKRRGLCKTFSELIRAELKPVLRDLERELSHQAVSAELRKVKETVKQ